MVDNYVTSKEVLYTILLNSDTEKIVEEYVLGYLKTHPYLLHRYARETTHPLVTEVKEKMEKEFVDLEPDSFKPGSNAMQNWLLRSILSEFLPGKLSTTQLEIIYSLFTEEQMLEANQLLDRGVGWF